MNHQPARYAPPNSTGSRLAVLQKIEDAEIEALLAENAEETAKEDKAFLLCGVCHHPITSIEYAIEIAGHHRHVFSNPLGLQFEIGCFSLANGCTNQGEATTQHTWFAGYQWRVALCANCHAHLGWQYLPLAPGPSFYGLILAHLIEGHSH